MSEKKIVVIRYQSWWSTQYWFKTLPVANAHYETKWFIRSKHQKLGRKSCQMFLVFWQKKSSQMS